VEHGEQRSGLPHVGGKHPRSHEEARSSRSATSTLAPP
jgi:hypothetical protein